MNTTAQELNKKTYDEAGNVTGLINLCTRAGLNSIPEMKHRFEEEYADYHPDAEVSEALKPLIKHKAITIVLGTWCGDSKLQVPHLYKILDTLNVSEKEVTLIGVDRSKNAENGLLDGLNILRVPTFILSEKGKELGRIVEFPAETLEKDLLNILEKK